MKAIKQKTTAFSVEGSCRKKFDDFLSILPSSPFAESKSNQSAVELVRNTGRPAHPVILSVCLGKPQARSASTAN